MNKINYQIATIFGIGKLPLAPGTWGSLFALIIWFLIIEVISTPILLSLTAIIFIVGVYTSSNVESVTGVHDPGFVVIDEWVGQWIALLFLPKTLWWGLFAFALFRLFDIWKPYPIKRLAELPKGWGIMMDDVLAGIYALIILNIFRFYIL